MRRPDPGADRVAPTVLLVGANGFIGGYIASALRRRGCRVLRGVRRPREEDDRHVDLARHGDGGPAPELVAALAGVDVVVNAAGILRETGRQTFDQVHVLGPARLARACMAAGVRRFVQVSSLGDPEAGEFIASKHRFDALLGGLQLASTILRPSIVYSTAGSYGGTSMLRALSALPLAQWLPGDGRWPVQPVAAEDLADIVAAAADGGPTGLFEVGGPRAMPLRDYQQAWRAWLRVPGTRAIRVPERLVSLQVWLWERIGSGPVGTTMWRMLRRGNVLRPGAWQALGEAFGIQPRPLDEVLAAQPSQVQDRWQAGFYFLGPILRAALVAVWLLSAASGFTASGADVARVLPWLAPDGDMAIALARAGACLDLGLGLWLATGWRPRAAITLMAASVVGYSLVIGVARPANWLDPLGGLAKNLVMLPALAMLWVLADRR